MPRVPAGLVALLVVAIAPGAVTAQVCEGLPGPLGALTFAAGHNALNGNSGPDFSGRVHTVYGSATASWTSSGIFPEVHSGEQENAIGHRYSATARPYSGQVALHLALHHPSMPWACVRAGAERVGWEHEVQLLETRPPYPGADFELLPDPDWIFGHRLAFPVGISVGGDVALSEGISLIPYATFSFVTFLEAMGADSETRYDWDGTVGLSTKLSHLVLTGTFSRYLRDSDALSHVRFGIAYPLGGIR